MTTTATTNFGWLMPDVGSEVDTWGTDLRTLIQAIDTELNARIGNPVTDNLLTVDGSLATPSHSFASDPDTGMFRGGANKVSLAAGGNSQFDFDSTGLTWTRTGAQTLSIESSDASSIVRLTSAANDAVYRTLLSLRKNRTSGVVLQNDILGGVSYFGYDGTTYQESVRQFVQVIEPTPGAAAMGGRFRMTIAALGSATPSQAVDIDQDTGWQYKGNVFLDNNRLFQLRSTAYGSIAAGAIAKVAHATDNGGFAARHNGTSWCHINNPSVQTIATDVNFTLVPGTNGQMVKHTGTLTANRAVGLGAGGQPGDWFTVTRTGGGAFNLNVGTGPLKALATNQWGTFVCDAAGAWYLAAFGSL